MIRELSGRSVVVSRRTNAKTREPHSRATNDFMIFLYFAKYFDKVSRHLQKIPNVINDSFYFIYKLNDIFFAV